MNFALKKNTETGDMALHTKNNYAYCPFARDIKRACGTWCALFRWNKDRRSIMQGCSNAPAIYLGKEK